MKPIAVDISELASLMDWQFDNARPFLNRATGELAIISEELLNEDVPSREEDMDDEVDEEDAIAASILSDEDSPWEAIPTVDTRDSYRAMVRFADGVEDDDRRAKFLRALEGKGAFRRFKECVADFDLEADWYAFKDAWLQSEATEWLESLGLGVAATSAG